MSITRQAETHRHIISPGRERYLTHGEHLMMVVIDFDDGPGTQPDPPHHHLHEQITYVAEGSILFFVEGVPHEMTVGDMIVVPSNVPHCIQLLTPHARLIDTFNPLREDFLTKAF